MRLPSARFYPRLTAAFVFLLLLFVPGQCRRALAQAITIPGVPAPMPSAFPTTAVGQTSAPVTLPLTIQTDGTAITGLTIPASQGGRQEYTVTSNSCALNTPLASGTICNVGVTFSPAYPGERPVPLEVSLADGTQLNFGMEGVGIGSQAVLIPSLISLFAGGDNTYFGFPYFLMFDFTGNLYFTNITYPIVEKLSSTGTLSTVSIAKPFNYGEQGGPPTIANTTGLVLDAAGNIYIADTINCLIRKIDPLTQTISPVVGNGIIAPQVGFVPPLGYAGDGGPALQARTNNPEGLAIDVNGNLYIADTLNHVIREVTASTGIITTIAGNHKPGYSGDNGPAINAQLYEPSGVAVDLEGNLYIADTLNHVIRKVSATSGIITTIAGDHTFGFSGDGGPATSAQLWDPAGITLDPARNLYIADQNNSRIRMVNTATGIITTIAGNGKAAYGGDGGLATQASLQYPTGVAFDSTGNLVIADSFNNRIRELNTAMSALSFAPTPVGLTSSNSPQTATLTNTGNAPLDFSIPGAGLNPALTTNFVMTPGSTCPQLDITSATAALPSGAACTLAIDFSPTVAGVNTGTATISDNSTPTPQVIQLNGTALPSGAGLPDFTLTASPSSLSVVPPATAKYTITVTGTNGFTDPVTLAVSGVLPSGATLSLSSTTIPGSGSANLTVSVPATYAQNRTPADPGSPFPLEYGMMLLPFSIVAIGKSRRQLAARRIALLILICLAGIAASGLSGCANIGLTGAGSTSSITILATSQYVQHSTTVQLTVNGYTEIKYH